jgi:hypothetical protein
MKPSHEISLTEFFRDSVNEVYFESLTIDDNIYYYKQFYCSKASDYRKQYYKNLDRFIIALNKYKKSI